MVVAGKIFMLAEPTSIGFIARKLRGFREEKVYEKAGFKLTLISEFRDLVASTDRVRAVFSFDQPIFVRQRGGTVPVVKTYDATVAFDRVKDQILLTVLEKKNRANMIANLISEILFIKRGAVVEVKIPSENMRRFHEENPEATKVIFFDQVDIPGVEKLSLYGESLRDTSLYQEYLRHGNIWYIVTSSRNFDITVGITRNGIVVAFGNVNPSDFLRFIEEEVFPLIPL